MQQPIIIVLHLHYCAKMQGLGDHTVVRGHEAWCMTALQRHPCSLCWNGYTQIHASPSLDLAAMHRISAILMESRSRAWVPCSGACSLLLSSQMLHRIKVQPYNIMITIGPRHLDPFVSPHMLWAHHVGSVSVGFAISATGFQQLG